MKYSKRGLRCSINKLKIENLSVIRYMMYCKINKIKIPSFTRTFGSNLISSGFSWQNMADWTIKFNNYKGQRSETLEYLTILYQSKEKALEHRARKSDQVKGSNNPAYQHGGKFSPFSDKFVKYQDIDNIIYTKDDVRKKKEQTIKDNPQNQPTHIEYYLNKGMSEDEAKAALSKRQTTFSLNKCIEKYGPEKGKERWLARQELWQDTLNDKSAEEIDRINALKGSSCGWGLQKLRNPYFKNKRGIVYFLRFYNKDIEFFKIGITSKTISERFWPEANLKDGLRYEIIDTIHASFQDCFILEQSILKELSDLRVKIQVGSFSSAECFKEKPFDIIQVDEDIFNQQRTHILNVI